MPKDQQTAQLLTFAAYDAARTQDYAKAITRVRAYVTTYAAGMVHTGASPKEGNA